MGDGQEGQGWRHGARQAVVRQHQLKDGSCRAHRAQPCQRRRSPAVVSPAPHSPLTNEALHEIAASLGRGMALLGGAHRRFGRWSCMLCWEGCLPQAAGAAVGAGCNQQQGRQVASSMLQHPPVSWLYASVKICSVNRLDQSDGIVDVSCDASPSVCQ